MYAISAVDPGSIPLVFTELRIIALSLALFPPVVIQTHVSKATESPLVNLIKSGMVKILIE